MSPLLITSQLCEGIGMASGPILGLASGGLVPILEQSVRLSVVVALLGFLLGAFGDLSKTLGKALKGEDALITGGVFRFFRHPNYTGEVIGWTSSCLAGFLAVAWKAAGTASEAPRRPQAARLCMHEQRRRPIVTSQHRRVWSDTNLVIALARSVLLDAFGLTQT